MSAKGRVDRELWALAQDVSRYLRRHVSPAVRLATALLLAASLAACNASASDPTMVQSRQVAPLAQEVSTGLPRGPGTYEVVPGSVFRDQRGVYQFEWLDPGQSAGPGHVAHVSRLRLVREDPLALEMRAGEDPVLHLTEGEDVGLIQQAQVGAVQPGTAYYPHAYSYWHPFSPGLVYYPRPAYYDPPRVVVVPDATTATSGGGTTVDRAAQRVTGGTASETARPPAQRVTGIQSAVSGRAGGTGAGSAVTSRNAASGAAAGAGSASAARSGGSVSAPRSGGFSSGGSSSGGSAAS